MDGDIYAQWGLLHNNESARDRQRQRGGEQYCFFYIGGIHFGHPRSRGRERECRLGCFFNSIKYCQCCYYRDRRFSTAVSHLQQQRIPQHRLAEQFLCVEFIKRESRKHLCCVDTAEYWRNGANRLCANQRRVRQLDGKNSFRSRDSRQFHIRRCF